MNVRGGDCIHVLVCECLNLRLKGMFRTFLALRIFRSAIFGKKVEGRVSHVNQLCGVVDNCPQRDSLAILPY